MKILVSLLVLLGAITASADWEDQQEQNKAEKAFKAMSANEAVASNAFTKVYPSLYFAEAGKKSLMHDDCISGNTYVGGAYRKCIDWSDEVNDCLETAIAPLTMSASSAPSSMKVKFYRKDSDYSSATDSALWLGSKTVAIPSCN